jgi:hypothetical protein
MASYYFRKTHQLGTRIRIGENEGTIIKITDFAVFLENEEGVVVVPTKEFNDKQVTIVKEDGID